jgi:stage IV sporulation protein B
MLTDGVLITDVSGFHTESGFVSPAADAGIRAGDVLKSINGKEVFTNSGVAAIINQAGANSNGEVRVVFERDGVEHTVKVMPQTVTDGVIYTKETALNYSTGGKKIGMWVKDSSAGIGTLTFYDLDTRRFAGLGHPVCDGSSGAIMPLYSGEAVEVSVNGIIRGRAGLPGELTGSFSPDGEIGELLVNGRSGVYGLINDGILRDSEESKNLTIPLGTRNVITKGPAVIISTIDGENPEIFEINIESINKNSGEDGKDMVIRVTDKRLITATGGIVQGMSGSPVIQGGRLVGAVTHVFVNNPEKGYAIFADTMYNTALNSDM